jgi:hypothetical protein
MAKLTLLEIVQDIMNDMDSDNVNSISDTEESMQIAQIVKTTYFEMIGRRDWPHLSKLTTLLSLGESARPTHLGTPSNMVRLDWFKYNKKQTGDTRNRFKDVEYKYPDEFIAITNERNLDNANVIEVTDYDGAKFQVFNDVQPKYFTSFDDKYIVLDSYDASLESTVQASNTQVRIYTIPTWTVDDDFVPDLPMETFPALLAEAKSVASFKLENEVDQKAEQQSERQQKRLSVNGWSVHGGIRYPNYGRRTGRVTSGSLFNKEQRS